MIEQQLHILGFAEEEIRLYLHLWQNGPTTAGRIAQRSGITRTSLYGMLDRLVQKGVVRCEEPGGSVRRFHAEPPGVFQDMFTRRRQEMADAQEQFHELLPKLYQKARADVLTPRLTLYQGKAQLQNILSDMLLYQDIETYSLWPISLMVEILGADYFRHHNITRIKRRIYTKAIWPEKYLINLESHPYLGGGAGFRREIRVAPSHIDFTMGYWIYGANVAVLSSAQECFGFVLESHEFAHMMKVQHMAIWAQSRRLDMPPKAVAAFAAKYGDTSELCHQETEKSKKDPVPR